MTQTDHNTDDRRCLQLGLSVYKWLFSACEREFYRRSVLVTAVARVQPVGKRMFFLKTIATGVRKPCRMPGTAQHYPPGATIF